MILGRSAKDQQCELAIQQSQSDRTCFFDIVLSLCPKRPARETLPEGLVDAVDGFSTRSRIENLPRLGLNGIIVGGMIAVKRGWIRAAGARSSPRNEAAVGKTGSSADAAGTPTAFLTTR